MPKELLGLNQRATGRDDVHRCGVPQTVRMHDTKPSGLGAVLDDIGDPSTR